MNKIVPHPQMKESGPEVADLHIALTFLLGKRVFEAPVQQVLVRWKRERVEKVYGPITRALVNAFQRSQDIRLTETVDEATAKALNKLLKNMGQLEPAPVEPPPAPAPGPAAPAVQHKLHGRVYMEHGAPARGIRLHLLRQAFGGKLEDVAGAGEQVTAEDGTYSFTFGMVTGSVLQVFALDGAGERKPLSKPLSEWRSGEATELDLVAEGKLQPLASEYARITKDLRAQLPDLAKLAEARESGQQRDLSLLNRATGWDARAIALTAMTEQLKADAAVALPAEGLYALLRTGLPSDKNELALVPTDVVEKALLKAREKGVIGSTDAEIAAFKASFGAFAAKQRLARPLPGSKATYAGMLDAADIGAEKDAFAKVLLEHRGDPGMLWAKAQEAGVSSSSIDKLQRQGRMAFLTGNNLALTTRLAQKPLKALSELVDKDLHEPEAWEREVRDAAGNDAAVLADMIPSTYAGGTVEDRLKSYTKDMARKVRRSFPTHALARTIAKDAGDTFRLGGQREATATFMKKAAEQGFRLGSTPLSQFMNSDLPAAKALAPAEKASMTRQIGKMQRTYQITPDDRSMQVLLQMGLTSAQAVLELEEPLFIRQFELKWRQLFPAEPISQEPKLVYRKAQQVSSVTHNLFTMAQKVESEVRMAGFSAPAQVQDEVKSELIKRFPTMSNLFGSQDFCECEHCRSVLSPAAYFVDLMQFIDPKDAAWAAKVNDWPSSHGGAAFPHMRNGVGVKPYDVLVERRPDLPHIALTCENTHTAMPYIDVVNEVLEYYVANGALDEKAAHNTDGATTAELLAEPQHVIREAYEKIRSVRYPIGLPYDPWVDTARRFSEHFGTPLHDLLEAFRPTENLFSVDGSIDRERICLERIGMTPEEATIFTDADPLAAGKWSELFGLWNGSTVIEAPTNAVHATLTIANADAKRFKAGFVCSFLRAADGLRAPQQLPISSVGAADSGGAGRSLITFKGTWPAAPGTPVAGDRLVIDALTLLSSAGVLSCRLGISYKELVALVRTGFVNPDLERMRILERLGVGPGQLRQFRDAANVALYEAHRDLFAEGAILDDTDRARLGTLSDLQQALIKDIIGYRQRIEEVKNSFTLTDAEIEAQLAAVPFGSILVFVDPDGGCSFDMTTVARADGGAITAMDLLRMNFFVRLWRKLGWTIEEVDQALQVFVPRNARYTEATLAQRPLRSALIHIAHVLELESQLPLGKQGRSRLMTLWSGLPSFGPRSLYAQLFLTRRILRTDDVFDHPFGQYLLPASIRASAVGRWFTVHRKVPVADRLNEALFAAEIARLKFEYDALTETQTLSFRGLLTDADKAAFEALTPSVHLPFMLADVQALGNAHALLKGHLPAIQGALGLTAEDVERILVDRGTTLATAELSMDQVSALHRYAFLAKAMKLSTRELIALKSMSGVDPFTALHPDPLASIEQDHPYTDTLRFVRLAARLRESGLKMDFLDHLVRGRVDPAGKYAPDIASALAFLSGLAKGIAAIRSEHAVPSDATTITDDFLKQRLGLLFPSDVADRFMAMLDGSVEFNASTPAGAAFGEGTMDGAAGVTALSFGPAGVKLTYRGVLFAQAKEDLLNAYPKPAGGAAHARSAVLETLLNDVEVQSKAFFDLHFAKRPAGVRPIGGFLDPAQYAPLFDPAFVLAAPVAEQARLEQRRSLLANAFLPYLQEQLVERFIVQQLTARTAADPTLVESLLVDEGLLNAAGPLVKIFGALGSTGVSATFYDAVNAVISRTTLRDASTRPVLAGGPALRPALAMGVDMEGYLEVPKGGMYRFNIELDKANAQAELLLDHLPAPTFLTGVAPNDHHIIGTAANEFIDLQPGRLYRFTLKVRNLGGGEVRLRMQGEDVPMGGLDRFALLPAASLAAALRADVLLGKVISLVQVLQLGERELRYVLTHRADFGGLDLSLLPGDPDEDPVRARTLFGQLEHLINYVHLRSRMAGGTDVLIDVFEKNAQGTRDEVIDLLATTLRRDRELILAALNVLGLAHGRLVNAGPLERLWTLIEKTGPLGASLADMRDWTDVVAPGVSSNRRATIAEELKNAVKARHTESAWADVAKSVFDHVRQGKRDALVAYLLEELGYERMEQLYEHFMIDPGVEPVIQTSRIRLAIASILLFIQRCLLNLEPQVHPSVIPAKHWEWMKRYRVWEANRKIFLFPENWLEPEFRDDKTHLFKELEGALLQGDVSSDLVEDAFFTYLRKLDELARLDIVGMHLETPDDAMDNTVHVIGRSFSQPHKYFYRQYKHRAWTPWEPVSAEIEGDHIVPVIWRDRLHVFWVTFMERPKPMETITVNAGVDVTLSKPSIVVDASLHWSEYANGEWTTRESGGMGGDAVLVSSELSEFKPLEVFAHVQVSNDSSVFVHLHGGGFTDKSFRLIGRNSGVLGATTGELQERPSRIYGEAEMTTHANRYAVDGSFVVEFKDHIGTGTSDNKPKHTILAESKRFKLMICNNRIPRLEVLPEASDAATDPAAVEALLASGMGELTVLSKPVFYQDGRHTFYVEPTVTEHTLEEWRDYVTQTVVPNKPWDLSDWLEDIRIKPQIPFDDPRIRWQDGIKGNGALIHVIDDVDMVLNSSTLLKYEGALIGPTGDPGIALVTKGIDTVPGERAILSTGLAEHEVAVANEGIDLAAAGLADHAGGFVVLGGGGMGSAIRAERRVGRAAFNVNR